MNCPDQRGPSRASLHGLRSQVESESFHMRTRCLPNCTQMGPHAVLADRTVRKSIMTGIHFLGCKCCGTYDRHNQVAQVALAFVKYELKFSGSTGSFDNNFVGTSANGKSKRTDGQVWGGPLLRLPEKSGL